MKTKTGWLMVILISSVQLALLLLAVMTLFSWFSETTESTVAHQACADNQAISRQIVKTLESSGLSTETIRQQPENIASVKAAISGVHMPNYGFICVLTQDGRQPIASFPEYPSLESDEIYSASFEDHDKQTSRLGDFIASNNKREQGRMLFDGREHFVSLEPIQDIGYLLVAQQRSQSVASMVSSISITSKLFFGATLLIGLACMCTIVAILNRMTAKVTDHKLGLQKQVTEREKQIVRTQNAVIFGLAKLAESRDNDTGEHLDRIRSYVMILSEDLKNRIDQVDLEFVHNIALASSLHDVGKVGIPDSILLKPGRLTKEEREVMELHTLIGGECLEAIQSRLGDDNQFMQIAKQIAYYHHERWDGNGYPHGLCGDAIPLVARIVAVADVYDALTSKRPYKDPLSHIESKGIILAGSGSQFDPEVVDAFLRHEDEFEAISRTQASLKDEDVLTEFHVLCERAQQSNEEEAATQTS
ncbi:MAG: HD domain-containing phosphohydrolase [Planctomycetota bacterium]